MHLKLAWRNVWRNRRRSLITMSAIVFSVLIITLTRSLQYGTYHAMESQAVQTFTGHMQIQAPGYQDEPGFNHLVPDDAWAPVVAEASWVTGVARRLTGYGLVSGDSASAGAMVLGIEPEAEQQVTTFLGKLTKGDMLPERPGNEAVLGYLLARNLQVDVGDSVVVITQGYHGQMGADLYRVQGLVRTGTPELDRQLMVIHVRDADMLFATEGQYTEVVIQTKDFRDAPEQAAALQASLQEVVPGTSYAVRDWNELMPELQQMIVLDNMGGIIFLFFMLLLVGFELFNTTSMSVLERQREFGILQAIGLKPGALAWIVMLELLLKIMLALVVSAVASGGLLWYLHGHPIPLSESLVDMYEEFGVSVTSLLFSTRPAVFLEPFISILVLSLVTTIYPVVRVMRLNVTAALRRGT